MQGRPTLCVSLLSGQETHKLKPVDDEITIESIEEFFEGDSMVHPRLSRKQQIDIDREVTMDDLERAIKKTKN